jgi:hypothetical protein
MFRKAWPSSPAWPPDLEDVGLRAATAVLGGLLAGGRTLLYSLLQGNVEPVKALLGVSQQVTAESDKKPAE